MLIAQHVGCGGNQRLVPGEMKNASSMINAQYFEIVRLGKTGHTHTDTGIIGRNRLILINNMKTGDKGHILATVIPIKHTETFVAACRSNFSQIRLRKALIDRQGGREIIAC